MAAKIYRINYKSDFILTLTSDAGWATPFCIKFWTGAPSMAYYAGWDGTTYTHCAYNPAEPTKLVVQFDDHHLPVGDLKFQIGYHFAVADFPNDTEDEVINPANIVTEIDGEEHQVMLDFTGETAPEIEFALPAYANEQQRIVNEQQRIANEQQRIANEQQRIAAEEQRVEEFGVIEEQAQQAISEAGSAAQAAYEAAGEAANVNAELDGTILTITNRQGTSTSVNTKGEQGEQGNPGQAATISVGTTTTGAPGTSAQVTNSGTSSAAVLDFTIPQGAKGDKGDQGEPGEVTEAEMNAALALKEDKANKVTEIDDNSTDVQYPSAKGVWTAIKNAIAAIKQWATSLFARTDGYYSRMIVGGAESVIGKENDLDAATDYVVQGATGIAKVNEVMGRSEKWNQLVQNGDFSDGTDKWIAYNSSIAYTDGVMRVSYTNNSICWFYQSNVFPVASHKYLTFAMIKASVSGITSKFNNWANNWGSVNLQADTWTLNASIATVNVTAAGNYQRFGITASNMAAGDYFDVAYCGVIDLTDIYGAGNEPTTVEQFEADVMTKYGKTLDEYFAYDAGSINNANVESLEVYDEGSILRTTLPINASTITGKVNGEGESVTIFPNGMRGVGTAYDSLIVDEDGWARRAIGRMASVDMGNLNWTAITQWGQVWMRTTINDIKSPSAGYNTNCLCLFYSPSSVGGDKTCRIGTNKVFWVYDSSYSDAASFKSAMQGVPLIYELETPIEYVLDTPILMTFNAYNGGVIRQIKGDMELATRMNIAFALNIEGFVNGASKEYINAASMQGFLSVLGTRTGGTWAMTWDETNKKYNFTFTPNS